MDCKDNSGKPYCYARRLYDRFKWNPEIRFEPLDYKKFPAGSKVFVGSTMELFGEWVKPGWLIQIFEWCKRLPDVTFIFLTKKPQNLIKWLPFPPNCYIGVSVTNQEQFSGALYYLRDIRATVKILSFEPLLSQVLMPAFGNPFEVCDWIICGQCTPVSAKTAPKVEWVKEIVQAADNAGIAVFLKDNLQCLFGYPLPIWAEDKIMNTRLRQEFPKFKAVK